MSSDSGKKQLVPGMTCATSDQHTSPLAALCEKLCVVQKYLVLVPAVFYFVQLKLVWEKLKNASNFCVNVTHNDQQ